jgi:hypothetical protein
MKRKKMKINELADIMNTEERITAPKHDMDISLIQPWSIPVMKTTLPPDILQTMIKLTDEIIAEETSQDAGSDLVGQIDSEYYIVSPEGNNKLINYDVTNQTELTRYFMTAVYEFLYMCKSQCFPMADPAELRTEEWLTNMNTMWVVSQQPGECNPIHAHSNCQISAVMHLKVPEMLTSKKQHRAVDDGSIVFTSNWSGNRELSSPNITFPPRVGDFYIFGAQQQHLVYPYRCAEGQEEVERRSVSFNSTYKSRQQSEPKWERVNPDVPPIVNVGGRSVADDPSIGFPKTIDGSFHS